MLTLDVVELLRELQSVDHLASVVIVTQGCAGIVGVIFHSRARGAVIHHTTRAQRAARRAMRRKLRAAILHILDESKDPKPPMRRQARVITYDDSMGA